VCVCDKPMTYFRPSLGLTLNPRVRTASLGLLGFKAVSAYYA
jgi:hypothetical protein